MFLSHLPETQAEFRDRCKIERKRQTQLSRLKKLKYPIRTVEPEELAVQIKEKKLKEEAARLADMKWAAEQKSVGNYLKDVEAQVFAEKRAKKDEMRETWKKQLEIAEDKRMAEEEAAMRIMSADNTGPSSMRVFGGADPHAAGKL